MDRVAVLASGGLDSAVLIAELSETATVFPIYVECGLAWEAAEQAALAAFVAALGRSSVVAPLVLPLPVERVYGGHWSRTGEGVPGANTPDSAVYLPGRNVLLIGLAAVWCSLNAVNTVAIGSLADNPFPDGTPAFFEAYGRLLSGALSHQIAVVAPFRGLHKSALVRRGRDLPLALTLTCMAPIGGVHCGACNKCAERRSAFRDAGVADPTDYAR
jgi:7-cyano-7-deazaguanine synthase